MANSAKKTVDQVKLAATSSLNSVMDRFYNILKKNTPVDTGRARANWRRYREVNIGRNETQTVISNQVPYIQRLDEGSSKQAPNGIVEPSWEEANKRGK